MEEYIPKVGDVVELINSGKNLSHQMIEILTETPIVTVTAVKENTRGYSIDFKGSNGIHDWDWSYADGHFKPLVKDVEPKPIIDDLTPLANLLKNII